MTATNLHQAIIRALRMHSSPTIGRGGVHGGQPGFVVYEPYVEFIAAAIEREVYQPILDRVRFLEAHRNVLQVKTTELLTRARAAENNTALIERELREEIARLTMSINEKCKVR